MNVQGPYSSSPRIPVARTERPAGPAAGAPAAATPAAANAANAAAPREASLWDLLTPEEREFFAAHAAMGPLAYRAGGRPADAPAAPTGQRIDVRA